MKSHSSACTVNIGNELSEADRKERTDFQDASQTFKENK